MGKKVLIVDDMEINREMLREILEDSYEVEEAENGRRALELIEDHHNELAVVLLDLIMPEMDGFAVLKVMKSQGWIDKIPVLVISGEGSLDAERRCFEYGVSDFVRKPFDDVLVKRRVQNIANLFQYQNQLEEKVEKQTGIVKKQYQLLQHQAEQLKKSNANIIDILGTVVESRNLESGEHINRVKLYTGLLARQMQKDYPEYALTDEQVELITSASSLHDVGKIAIPDHILLKPGKLTDEEFECMKTHTTKGCELLYNIKGVWSEEYSRISYEICRHHHERYDGRGYPDRLKGEEIPISAQLVSIADVYDALVNERVYKSAYTKEEAFHMIVTGECGIFSPKLLECFRKVRKAFEELSGQ